LQNFDPTGPNPSRGSTQSMDNSDQKAGYGLEYMCIMYSKWLRSPRT